MILLFMSNNVGKIFEQAIKDCIPKFCFYYRLPDSAISFSKTQKSRFSNKNICDSFLFDSDNGILYALELKTTKAHSFSFESPYEEVKVKREIHKHQILGLLHISEYKRTKCGFLLNFRIEKEHVQRTYFIDINDFIKLINTIDKKSFNEKDLLKYGNSIEIKGNKLRTNYTWDMYNFIKNTSNEILANMQKK